MKHETPIDFVPRWPEVPPDESDSLRAIRLEIYASREETWRLMRAQHADLAARLDRLAEKRRS